MKTQVISSQEYQMLNSKGKPLIENDLHALLYNKVMQMQAYGQFPKHFLLFHLANERKSASFSFKGKPAEQVQQALTYFKSWDLYKAYQKKMAFYDMLHNKKLKERGMLPGIPDWGYILPKGIVGFFEQKRTAKCKMSPDQKRFFAYCEMFNIPCDRLDGIEGIDKGIEIIQKRLQEA